MHFWPPALLNPAFPRSPDAGCWQSPVRSRLAAQDFALAAAGARDYVRRWFGDQRGVSESTAQLPDDRDLLRSVAARDKEAFRQLYDRHSGMLFGLVLKILGDRVEAEDVLQEAFVQIWKTAERFDIQRAQPLGWLIMLTRSRAIDRLRARATRVRITAEIEDPAPEQIEMPDEQAAAGESRQAVRQALQSLPADQRRPIELAYFSGLSQSEIAEQLGEPLGTIKTRMRTGMLRLRECLAEEAADSSRKEAAS
jgi:RNA polymerase sigma-70 factor (ECF subfamily)